MSEDDRTLFLGGIKEEVTEEILYELFLQAGPLEKVKIPTDKEGRPRRFAFITFQHVVSVPYAKQVMEGVKLFGRPLNLQSRGNNSNDSPISSPRASPQYNSDPQQSRHPNFNRSNTWHGQGNQGRSPNFEGPILVQAKSPQYEIQNPYTANTGGYMSMDVLRGHNSAGSLNDMSMQPRDTVPIDVRRQRVLEKQQMSINMHHHRNNDSRGRYDDRYGNRDRDRRHRPYDHYDDRERSRTGRY